MGRYAVMDRGSGSARLHGQGIWQCEVARVAGRAVAHHPGNRASTEWEMLDHVWLL